MRMPRVQFSVRWMIVLVACLALGFFVAREFSEGLPPRYVLRGIPARIAQLRPGMTWEETREVLGLDKSWIWGGTSAGGFMMGHGSGRSTHEVYYVRPMRIVSLPAQRRIGGGLLPPETIYQSTSVLQIRFKHDYISPNWRKDGSGRLVWASYSSDSRTIAEMPPRSR